MQLLWMIVGDLADNPNLMFENGFDKLTHESKSYQCNLSAIV